jgi:glycosyltransferase involved in cell wall biosynthesis
MTLRLLFFPGFVSRNHDYKASDAIGYGITVVDAIVAELPRHGVQVRCVEPEIPTELPDIERRRLAWIQGGYQALLRIPPEEYDAVFIFHTFQQFPQEVRRIFADLSIGAALTGYTLGSHWDPTDEFRFIHYPGMEVTDLANFLAMDRVCLVSEYVRGVLLRNVAQWQADAARRLEERLRVVGLPINTAAIDAARTNERLQRPTIIFNHSMVPSKDPGLFLDAAERALTTHDCQVVITRDVKGSAIEERVAALQQRFPGRVQVSGTLSLDAYFRLLWQADIQISTARHETFGISTVEAMYTETCCLLPNRASYPEITDSCPEALYDTPAELFARLDHYLRDVEDRRRLASELRRRALRHTPGQVVPRIAAAIAEAVDATRARRLES